MQHVVVLDRLVGVEMKPALSALGRRSRVPAQARHLVATAGEGDQVLLQRFDAEGVGDAELRRLAVGAVGAQKEPAIASEEGRGAAEVGQARVVEVPQHGRLVGDLHGEVVMRAEPALVLVGVATGAGLPADVGGGGCARRGALSLGVFTLALTAGAEPEQHRARAQGGCEGEEVRAGCHHGSVIAPRSGGEAV